MQAYYLIKNGSSKTAFELRDLQLEEPGQEEVTVEIEAYLYCSEQRSGISSIRRF